MENVAGLLESGSSAIENLRAETEVYARLGGRLRAGGVVLGGFFGWSNLRQVYPGRKRLEPSTVAYVMRSVRRRALCA